MDITFTTEAGEVVSIPWAEEESLTDNSFFKFDEVYEPRIPVASLSIYDWLDKNMARSDSTFIQRGSAMGYCPKRLQFQRLGAKATPLTPRKRIRYAFGDMIEYAITYFISQALVGPGKMYSEVFFGEKAGSFPIARGGGTPLEIPLYNQVDTETVLFDGTIIKCHADGWGKLNSTGEWELIEVKSAADFGFRRFKEQGPTDYTGQAFANICSNKSQELGVKQARFYYCSLNGNLYDKILRFDAIQWLEIQKKFLSALSEESLPPQYELMPYHPLIEVEGKTKRVRDTSSNLKEAPFPCSYCPYLEQCHGKFEIYWEKEKPHKVFGNPAIKNQGEK